MVCGRRQTFVLEVLVTAAGEEGKTGTSTRRTSPAAGRLHPRFLRHRIVPDFWKIEGMPGRESLQVVDAAIRDQPGRGS